ncbi:MAG: hypothetical protein KKD44_25260 [Proteobacteria bacterium]|nr:hypothetical protein [Pseudomonadota bacterium]
MDITKTQHEVFEFFRNHDFVPTETIEDYGARLENEGNEHTLIYVLNDFKLAECPRCGTAGAYKWHFLGKLNHPECGYAWFVTPGNYIGAQIKGVFRTGMDLGGSLGDDADKKGEGAASGCLSIVIGFLMGAMFRLPFALAMIPIQALARLGQEKP